mgnify:CR=1 FL=1
MTSPSPSPLRLLLINGAVFLVLLLLLELALRLLGIARPAFYRFDPVRGFAHRPGAEGWWTREGRGWVRINRAGFRDDDHPPVAAPGTLRLAVLADSFGEAFQVNQADTWWKGLERRLQARPDCPLRRGFPGGVEVMNFGTGAYGTGQELLTWRQAVRPLRPQVVLLAMYLGNDLDDNTPKPRDDRPVFRLGADGRLQQDDSFLQSPASRFRRSLPGQLLDGLVAHSRLAQLLSERQPLYAQADLRIQQQGEPPEQVAQKVLEALPSILKQQAEAPTPGELVLRDADGNITQSLN